MLLMAAMMAWWLIPAALVIWIGIKFISNVDKKEESKRSQQTIYL